MLTTNDEGLWKRAWSYKDHGKSWDAVQFKTHPPGFRWLHESFGTNWRLTEMQSAIGRIQLTRMPRWHQARADNARLILDTCDRFPDLLRVPRPGRDIDHAWYKCYVFIKPDGLGQGWTRDRIIDEINACGAPCMAGSCSEVYLEKAFENSGFRPADRLPVASELGETSLMFPVHPTLNESAMRGTCEAIERVMTRAGM